MTTVHGFVGAARSRLVEAGVAPAEAACDAEVLARNVLGWDRTDYVARGRIEAPPGFANRYDAVLMRRARREPVSLITGNREFWGLDFEITADVLTPRPETELLVEEAVARLRENDRDHPHVMDVGTGSGCLAVAIATELGRVHVTASDVSPAALSVARRNAARHGVSDRIVWVCAPLLEAIRGRDAPPDLVVANLPYIPTADIAMLPPEVRRFEPRTALDGGPDGLDAIRRLVDGAHVLRPGAYLLLEVGIDQSGALTRYLEDRPALSLVGFCADLQGIPRVATIQYAPMPLTRSP